MIYFAHFINKDGFVTANPFANAWPGEGNGFLNTGLAHACGMYPNPEDFPAMIQRCRHSDMIPLIWRSPHKKNPGDDQKCDDYWGALLLSENWALEILRYAEDTGWNFNIVNPYVQEAEYRFDRFPAFPPFLRACAGKKLAMMEVITLALQIFSDAFDLKDADSNKKAFCRLKKAREVSTLCWVASKLWIYKAKKKFGKVGGAWKASHFINPLNDYDE